MLVEKLGKNIAAELDKIVNRIISERKIESLVYVDKTLISDCAKFIALRSLEREDSEWNCVLMVAAVMKFRPIQRLNEDPNTNKINEIFAITIITDFMPHIFKTEKYYSRARSGSFLRHFLSYFLNGSNDPHAILLTLQCITSPEFE